MFDTILIGIGLSADAMAVSMTNGMIEKDMKLLKKLLIAFFFGFFQFLMPLIGYLIGSSLSGIIIHITPYLSLVILCYIGGKMIYEALKKNKEESNKEITFITIFIQAIATSLDALAVGIIFVGRPLNSCFFEFLIIGIITFTLSIISIFIGKKFGSLLKSKSEIIGGIILILIGLKIFIEYLLKIM